MVLRRRLPVSLVALLALWPLSLSAAPVDLALVLALDVSVSVDRREFELQRDGLAAAFRDSAVHHAVSSGEHGAVAVTVLLWSGIAQQRIVLPWSRIDGREAALGFAARIAGIDRAALPGATAVGAALLFSARRFERLPFASDRRVIDLSGDGRSNTGPLPPTTHPLLAAAGIVVNALAVEHEDDWLAAYYRREVIRGPGAFVERAADYADFRRAILRKLLREIRFTQVTEDTSPPVHRRIAGRQGD